MTRYVSASIVLYLTLLPSPVLSQDAEAGAVVFKRCMACHNAETATNKFGPHLNGVIGREAGSLDGYNYSKAMKDAGAGGLVWDEAALSEFLGAPRAKVPGTKMVFPGLKTPEEIENVIAYLKSFSD